MDNTRGTLALQINDDNEPDEELELEASPEDAEPIVPDSVGEYALPSQFFQNVGSSLLSVGRGTE